LEVLEFLKQDDFEINFREIHKFEAKKLVVQKKRLPTTVTQ